MTSDLTAWIGRQERLDGCADLAPVASLAATLDLSLPLAVEGALLPPVWHWLYFLPRARQSELGQDGHPKLGGFMPPVSLPRRMWAGSQIDFLAPIILGKIISRTTTIEAINIKRGRSGEMVFVTLRHDITCGDERALAIVERQDIVYRAPSQSGTAEPETQTAPTDSTWQRTLIPDETMLFRYSALTFNAHRIHYDRRYAIEVEGYPDLVVHGPLTATLLLDLLRRQQPDARVTSFRFKAVRPAYCSKPLLLQGIQSEDRRSVWLCASDGNGQLTMEATAVLEPG